MIYLLRGTLPWADLMTSGGENEELILKRKETIKRQDLCYGVPDEFITYFDYIHATDITAKINYSYLRKIFRNLFVRKGYKYDNVFDWTILKFLSEETGQKRSFKPSAPEVQASSPREGIQIA
jgi:hypothetical protein